MTDNKNESKNKDETPLDASLKSVPVFTVALKGKIQKIPIKDDNVLIFFLDFDDAVEQLISLKLQNDNANELEVHPISLLDFLIIMQQNQKKEEAKIILRPHRNSINQIKLTAKHNKFEKMPSMQIPLFFARNEKLHVY